jgi:uncharacterized protein (TIGR02466 family)
MQTATDIQSGIDSFDILRPFGPCIVKARIPQQVQTDLTNLFERNNEAKDHSTELAGNMIREFSIDDSVLNAEQAQRFIQMLADGSAEVYKASKNVRWENTKRYVTQRHIDLVDERMNNMQLSCAIHSSWGNVSVSGDFNPSHSHSGMISGVGYLRLPDDIEDEWDSEDHDPSVGMINFIHGSNLPLDSNTARFKPTVGDIYFFPAWLLHEVFPFRSKGERWSFSFNTTIENLYEDTELTTADKKTIKERRNDKS